MTSLCPHSKMAVFHDRDKHHFPLQNIQSVIDLFKDQLESTDQPNLALLSIVLGIIEQNLTVNRALGSHFSVDKCVETIFPPVQLSTVEALYHRFTCLIRGSIDLTLHDSPYASRELIKRVSDVVWAGLSRGTYKDKAHLQSLYVYLTGNKLDCFGLALAVVAACQQLGFHDVHLALSEDHAWVVFGPDGTDTAEVTWHGKGNEDKRGQPITTGVAEKSWLYLNGHPVVCNRHMEVASMVAGINPAINATTDSVEMGSLQQELLWLLYDMGHLDRYPMGLGNLGDLEEITPTPGRPSALMIFHKAIDSNRQYYNNQHVYPYTYLGGYYYRKGLFKEALRYWAAAGQAISHYNYSREDEEIYKEFLEIANEFIPQIIKICTDSMPHTINNTLVDVTAPLLHDPECYVMLLRFYDGICEWEEGSSTPVLHITWANHLFHSLSKFTGETREGVHVEEVSGEEEEDDGDEGKTGKEPEENAKRARRDRRECSKENMDVESRTTAQKRGLGKPPRRKPAETNSGGTVILPVSPEKKVEETKTPQVKAVKPIVEEEDKIKSTIEELESKVGAEDSQSETPNPNIADLAKACGEGILNPDYLLGVGEPFTTSGTSSVFTAATDTRVDFKEFLSSQSDGSAFPGISIDAMLKADTPIEMAKGSEARIAASLNNPKTDLFSGGSISLRSAKMKGMKRLLLAQKLNANAIKLQLTAQSQVHLKQSKVSASQYGYGSTRKRLRRD